MTLRRNKDDYRHPPPFIQVLDWHNPSMAVT